MVCLGLGGLLGLVGCWLDVLGGLIGGFMVVGLVPHALWEARCGETKVPMWHWLNSGYDGQIVPSRAWMDVGFGSKVLRIVGITLAFGFEVGSNDLRIARGSARQGWMRNRKGYQMGCIKSASDGWMGTASRRDYGCAGDVPTKGGDRRGSASELAAGRCAGGADATGLIG